MNRFLCTVSATASLLTIAASAQILNGSFETWSSPNGYLVPDHWWTFNDMTAPDSTFTCTPGTPGAPGQFFLRLEVLDVGMPNPLCGMATSGDAQHFGFPINDRPAQMDGRLRYTPLGTDAGYIQVEFSKWNPLTWSGDPVGFGCLYLYSLVSSWQPFSVPINYYNSDMPDTVMVTLSCAGTSPTPPFTIGTTLDVDSLELSGSTVGIMDQAGTASRISIYPSVATDRIMLHLPGEGTTEVLIHGMDGRSIRRIAPAGSSMVIAIDDMAPGSYAVVAKGADGSVSSARFIKR